MRIKQAGMKKGRIEIIPMIDVVFFLLVFSMLSSLALAAIDTPKVEVPAAAYGEKGTPTRCFVTLTSDRKLYINQTQITPDKLTGELSKQVDRNPEVFIIINCDENNAWGDFRALMAATYKADPKNVAIMTRSKTGM
ncbi:MAG TPA: biopolymer transporter ExbD [Armatimonadota bacterium]|jgi:biopolymer transport protein ExbD